jgi:hypothetical protein
MIGDVGPTFILYIESCRALGPPPNELASADRLCVAGTRLDFPCVGTIVRIGARGGSSRAYNDNMMPAPSKRDRRGEDDR